MKRPILRIVIIAGILCGLAGAWWFGPRFGNLRITDLTTSQSFTVKALSSSRSGITIHVKGYINGSAYVYVNNYQKESLSGNVDWQSYSDWFENECTIYFEPGSASSGELEISYTLN
jgi:hypothetical protein